MSNPTLKEERAADARMRRALIGRRIVDARPNGRWEDNGVEGSTQRVWMHDWVLVLDNGSEVVFLTEEHPAAAEYGVDLIVVKRDGRKGR